MLSFYFLSILLLRLSCFEALPTTNLTTDQLTLTEFKNHLTKFNPQNMLRNNWSTSVSVCQWYGVSCGILHERVTALRLPNMNLGGNIPPLLANLSFLISLNLSGNSFHGQLPKELAKLHRLKSLDLSSNAFGGEMSSWFGYYPKLQFLSMGNNSFTGTIPSIIYNMSTLQHVDLSSNDLSGSLPGDICNFLSNLEYLRLSYNQLSGEIPSSLGKCNKLQVLRLYDKFTGQIPKGIENLTKLTHVSIGNPYLQGIGITGFIPSGIFNISSLEIISFRNNSLSGSIPDDMCLHLPNLVYLNLASNELYGKLPTSIGKCSSLQILALDRNKFTGSIPKIIGNLTALKQMYISQNNLEEIGLTGFIPSGIFNISSLETISLADNSLSGSIPDDMCLHLPNLVYLYLESNELYGKLPTSIGKCSSLQILGLQRNKFTGSIPKTIGNLTALKEIYLQKNNLEGQIPLEIGNLIHLEVLKARDLNISAGPIPRTLFNISSLKTLDMQNCNLYGEIPRQINNLYKLEIFNVGFNELSGSIPSQIFNSSTIRGIYIYSNNLSGHLQSTKGNLAVPNLEKLLLWENYLSGPIPSFLSNATKLTQLQLLQNSFTGFIPTTFGNLRLLQWLDFRSNNLITDDGWSFLSRLSNCKELKYLDISDNPLHGSLPTSIGNLSISLQIFYAQSCKITGHVPIEVGNLSNLISLSLSDNDLVGPIPRTIERLQKLQSLYLPINRLDNFIPNEICHLRMLYTLQITENYLEGPIPTCLSNLTSLQNLWLGSNKLSSTLPSTMWSLNDILNIDISSNFLIGSLPPEIGNLKHLIMFDASNNKLSSNLSGTLGDLKNLQNLSLANNFLHGSIPSSFGEMISLVFIDLSNNTFSGVIPKSLEALTKLEGFNVSFNQLVGEIPTGGPFRNFTAESFLGNKALCGLPRLQVPPCKTQNSEMAASQILLRYIFPVLASTIIAIVFAIVLIRRHRQRSLKRPKQESILPLVEWRRISQLQIQQATNGFSLESLLGSGGFGSVYKGTLLDGMIVAIKVFNLELEDAFKSFQVETDVIRNVRHRNLVKIISSCCNLDFKALVLEFIPNGSLENWLYFHTSFLNLLQRLNIMIDVGSALEYLHHGHSRVIVHCDLKPSNVLLDEDMVAHVADFGIAKLLSQEDSLSQTLTMATIGYMAPEYGSMGIVSTQSDVYSFGILIMETFTKKKPTDEMFTVEMSLKNWVEESLPNSITDVVDANLLMDEGFMNGGMNSISSILELALNCTSKSPVERGNMEEVVVKLKKIRIKLVQELKSEVIDFICI